MSGIAHTSQSAAYTRGVSSLSIGPWTTAGQLIAVGSAGNNNTLNAQLTTQQYINIVPFTPDALLNLGTEGAGPTPCVFQATTGSGNNYVGPGTLTAPVIIGFDVLLSSTPQAIALPIYGYSCWVRVRQPNPPSGGPFSPNFILNSQIAIANGNTTLTGQNGGDFVAAQTVQNWLNPAGNAIGPPSMLSGLSSIPGAVDFYQFTRSSNNNTTPWTGVAYQDLTYLGAGAQEYVWQCPDSSTAIKLPNPVVAVGSDVTLTEDCAIQMPTGYVGLQCWCIVRQTATPTPPWTVGFGSSTVAPAPQARAGPAVTWVKGVQPTMSVGANAVDLYQFVWDPITTVSTVTGSQTGVWMGIPLQAFAGPVLGPQPAGTLPGAPDLTGP